MYVHKCACGGQRTSSDVLLRKPHLIFFFQMASLNVSQLTKETILTDHWYGISCLAFAWILGMDRVPQGLQGKPFVVSPGQF